MKNRIDRYLLEVESLAKNFKEKGQRKRRWFSQAEAARQVNEHGLSRLIRSFSP